MTSQSSTCDNQAVIDNLNSSIQCYAICFYSICFSVIKPCSYWNAFAEHGDFFYQETLNDGQQFTCNKLPSTVNIYGANVDIVFGTEYQGKFSPTSICDKLVLEKFILDNATENTGFLLWTSSYSLSCIFQHHNGTTQNRTKYFLVALNKSQTINLFEKFCDSDSLVNKFCNIVSHKLKSDEIQYNIKFLSCSCQLTKPERQKIIKKHKSTTEKKSIADRKKQCKFENYANLELAKKKIRLEKAASKYKSMHVVKNKDLLQKYAEKYKSMDPIKKTDLLQKKAEIYKAMAPMKKKDKLQKYAEKYKSMDPIKRKMYFKKMPKNTSQWIL